jgi:hypothetical protein
MSVENEYITVNHIVRKRYLKAPERLIQPIRSWQQKVAASEKHTSTSTAIRNVASSLDSVQRIAYRLSWWGAA